MDMSVKEDSLGSEALDVVVQLLFQLDEKRELDDFYDRICEAVCLQTSMERAILFLYDAERRLVLPVGSHGVYREIIAHGYGSLEETPIAQRALAEDRVVETSDFASEVPARYANMPGVTGLTCTPVAAAGRWLGVIFADRDGEPFELTDGERSTMHALGRTAALASHVREVTRQLGRRGPVPGGGCPPRGGGPPASRSASTLPATSTSASPRGSSASRWRSARI